MMKSLGGDTILRVASGRFPARYSYASANFTANNWEEGTDQRFFLFTITIEINNG